MTTIMGWMAVPGIGVLTAAAAASLLLTRASASLRHLVWTTAALALVAIPAFEI